MITYLEHLLFRCSGLGTARLSRINANFVELKTNITLVEKARGASDESIIIKWQSA